MDAKLITRDHLLGLIENTTFQYRGTTTVCTLIVNGFPVVGESHCVFREKYTKSIGEKVSYENALEQLRKYELYCANKNAVSETVKN